MTRRTDRATTSDRWWALRAGEPGKREHPGAGSVKASSGLALTDWWRPKSARVRGSIERNGAVVAVSIVAIALGAVIKDASRPLSNPDTWLHLRLGHEFLTGASLWHPPALSEFATERWLPTQWASQLTMAAVESIWGLKAVSWLFGVTAVVFVLVCYRGCRTVASEIPSALATFVAVFASMPSLSARPQLLGLILVSVTAIAWLNTSEDGRPRWWLLPMTWAWASLHGYWSIGIMLGAVALLGIVAERRFPPRQLLRVGLVPVLSMVAAAVTPLGPDLLLSQLAVSQRASYISEWAPTSLRDAPAMVALAMACLLVLRWGRRGVARWPQLALGLFALILALYAVRFVAVGAVVLAPLLAQAWSGRERSSVSPVSDLRIAVVTAIIAGGLLAAVAPTRGEIQGLGTLDQALDDLPDGSVVMADGGIGSWMAWRHPRLIATVDGLVESYSVGYLDRYVAAVEVRDGWRRYMRDTGASVAILEKDAPLAHTLAQEPDWYVLDSTSRWVLLERDDISWQ